MKPLRLFCITAVVALAACGTSPTAITRTPADVRASETQHTPAPPPSPAPMDGRGPNTFGSGN